jgi:hypothetical protein|eukprot:7391683-Prymnesium_polylepis.3
MSSVEPAQPPPAPPSSPPDVGGGSGPIIGLLVFAALAGLVLLDLSCRKARGIGLCDIFMLCPARLFGHTTAILTLRENHVQTPATPSYEMNTVSKLKLQFDLAAKEDDTLRVAKVSHASLRDIELRQGAFKL